MKSPHRTVRLSLCFVTSLLLAACESHPDRREMIEEARHSVPPMAAQESFFNGAVIARLNLGNDAGAGSGPGGEADNGGHAGAGTGSGGAGRHGRGGGMGGGGGRGAGGGQSAGGDGALSTSMHSSNMPPAMLRLRLENTTAAPIDIEVRELDSELGDFAVRPEKVTLTPGQSAEFDPMESLLGLDTYSLPVTITLRSEGKTETKVLTLQLVNPPANASPSGAPPPASTPASSSPAPGT